VVKYVCLLGFAMGMAALSSAFAQEPYAEISDVSASKAFLGSSYSIYATVKSSDKDCDHYVNWWEAVSEDGTLLYRRTLGHPHSNEQPFNRVGSTRAIDGDTVLYVRAHLHPFGYSPNGMKGSANSGFKATIIPEGFAAELANSGEIPTDCDSSKD